MSGAKGDAFLKHRAEPVAGVDGAAPCSRGSACRCLGRHRHLAVRAGASGCPAGF